MTAVHDQIQFIDVDIDGRYTPRSLTECLRLMPSFAAACRQGHTFLDAVMACDITRSAWAAHLAEWTETPQFCHRVELEAGMRDCHDAVKSVRESFQGEQHRLVGHFVKNMERRLKLITILHTAGVDATKAEMRRYEEALRHAA